MEGWKEGETRPNGGATERRRLDGAAFGSEIYGGWWVRSWTRPRGAKSEAGGRGAGQVGSGGGGRRMGGRKLLFHLRLRQVGKDHRSVCFLITNERE